MKLATAVTVTVGIALIGAFLYYQASPKDAPVWLYVVLAVIAPIGIWVDIKARREKTDE